MSNRVRKLVVFVAMVAVAIGSGLAPRLAHAALHGVPTGKPLAGHPHQEAVDNHANTASAPCQDHGVPGDHKKGSPDHNCCAASCAAVAFIFADIALCQPAAGEARVVTLPETLDSVSPKGLDPPPRLG